MKMSESCRLRNMLAHSRFKVGYVWASGFKLERLMMINRMLTPRSGRWAISLDQYKELVLKFHDDPRFVAIHKAWLATKDKWFLPTFDHIHPKAKKGPEHIDNLQVLTWFENRCKNDIAQEDWSKMKTRITDYFL